MIKLIVMLFICLFVTIISESVPLVFMKDRSQWLKAGLICNLITNPLLNVTMFLVSYLLGFEISYFICVCLFEIAIIFVEAYFYSRMLDNVYSKCLKVSLVCNLMSFAVGILVFMLLIAVSGTGAGSAPSADIFI